MRTHKIIILFLTFVASLGICMGQNISGEYTQFVKKADSLFKAKSYKESARSFSKAFESIGWKGLPEHRYNAACAWSLANVPDSAFFQLYRIATKVNYKNYQQVSGDPDLIALHQDKRWAPLLEMILENKNKAEAHLNKPLVAALDTIYLNDTKYRNQLDEVEKKFGWNSKEMDALWKTIGEKDSLNQIVVTGILDKYGWLGEDIVGEDGNSTLFLVIQHSKQATQEKYLPMMREAVKNGKALGWDLAMLEDRVALHQGKMQIYGSQLYQDSSGVSVDPIEDPDQLDQRRAKVGLPPMAEYLKYWNMKWDVEQYKKELPNSKAYKHWLKMKEMNAGKR